MYAEFNKITKVMFALPTINSDWKCCIKEAQNAFHTFISAVSKYEDCIVICQDTQEGKNIFKNHTSIEFIELKTDDTWIRDYGVISIKSGKKTQKLNFIFNGWGNKFYSNNDNNINKQLFDNVISYDFVLEGGSIESNGDGVILTTSRCLLNSNRNPNLSKSQIETRLKQYLNIKKILWLEYGYLRGDDTDSHIDTLVRFVDKSSVMYISCNDKDDEHYQELKLMREELEGFNEIKTLIPLPFVSAMYDKHNNRLPATYANFLITNRAVFVPTYNDKNDKLALSIIGDFFKNRDIIGVDSTTFIKEHGSLHCLSMQLYD